MTAVPESHRALLEDGQVGVLSTVGSDGRPQMTALWFLVVDGEVRISLNETRRKTKNLMANPKVTFFVFDPTNPYRTLEIRADATWEYDGGHDGYAFADEVGAKYDSDLRRMDQPGDRRVVVTLHPVHVTTNG